MNAEQEKSIPIEKVAERTSRFQIEIDNIGARIHALENKVNNIKEEANKVQKQLLTLLLE